MRTEVLEQEKNIVKVKVEFEAEEFAKAYKKTLGALSQKVNIPGFRKGHIPNNVLEMRFGREALYSETLEKMLPEHIPHIVEDYDIDLLDNPTLDFDVIQEGCPVACTLIFEVIPDAELPENLGEIEVEKLRIEITEDAVNRTIRNFRREHATITPVDRPVEDSDVIDADLSVLPLDGESGEDREPFVANDQVLDLSCSAEFGERSIRSEIRSALLGHSKGDVVDVEFDIEEDHSASDFAGKRLRYTLTIKNVSEIIFPDLNEEFFKKVYGEDTDILTEEACRNRVREDLKNHTEANLLEDARRRALEKILALSTVEPPEKMVVRRMEDIREDDEERFRAQHHFEMSDLLEVGKDTELVKNYMVRLRERAEDGVRHTLVLNAIAKKYDVKLEQGDIDAELDRVGTLYNVSQDMLKALHNKNDKSRSELINSVLYAKIMDRVMQDMQVKEVDTLSEDQNSPQNQAQDQDQAQEPEHGQEQEQHQDQPQNQNEQQG